MGSFIPYMNWSDLTMYYFRLTERNRQICKWSVVVVTAVLVCLCLGLMFSKSPQSPDPEAPDFDFLVFPQIYPKTQCFLQIHKDPTATCRLPSIDGLWTTTGIRPVKFGTNGPTFCNKSLSFNSTTIIEMKHKLIEFWTDDEDVNFSTTPYGNNSIWYRNWKKHGTCAVSLSSMDTEEKYFETSVHLAYHYNMKFILEICGIKLNSTLNVTDYWRAIKSTLKTNTWIGCVFNHDTEQQILSEINICLNKSLNLIDCDGIVNYQQNTNLPYSSLTNCDATKPILFLDYSAKYVRISYNTSINKKIMF